MFTATDQDSEMILLMWTDVVAILNYYLYLLPLCIDIIWSYLNHFQIIFSFSFSVFFWGLFPLCSNLVCTVLLIKTHFSLLIFSSTHECKIFRSKFVNYVKIRKHVLFHCCMLSYVRLYFHSQKKRGAVIFGKHIGKKLLKFNLYYIIFLCKMTWTKFILILFSLILL